MSTFSFTLSNATIQPMTYSGRYGLVHPNAEKVYAATRLWFLFGEEPDFLAMLDDLYPVVATPLLDLAAPCLRPVSSIEDATAKWGEIEAWAQGDASSPALVT